MHCVTLGRPTCILVQYADGAGDIPVTVTVNYLESGASLLAGAWLATFIYTPSVPYNSLQCTINQKARATNGFIHKSVSFINIRCLIHKDVMTSRAPCDTSATS